MAKKKLRRSPVTGKSLTSGSAVTPVVPVPGSPEPSLEGNGGSRGRKRGTKRMREFGYKRVEIWLDKSEAKAIYDYCSSLGFAVATFIRRNAVATVTQKGGDHDS